MSRAVLVLAATIAAGLSSLGAPGRAADDATRQQLAELKALCDADLVAPVVCLEKQRAILGLPPGGAGAPSADAAAAIGALPAAASDATVHESALGFRVTLPPGWTAVAPEHVDAGFDVLRNRADGNPEAARLVERLREQAVHTRADVFFRGRDSLQVSRSDFRPPEDAAGRAQLCERLEATTSKAAARPLRTYACGARVVSGAPVFYVERDALLPDTRTIQYWVPETQGNGIRLVMTCRDADADERRREIEAIVATLRWR